MKKLLSLLIEIYKRFGYCFQGRLFSVVVLFYKINRVSDSPLKAIKEVLSHFKQIKVFKGDKKEALGRLLGECEFDDEGCSEFIYTWDIYKTTGLKGRILGNCTIDYRAVLEHGLEYYRINDNDSFSEENNALLDDILSYLKRLVAYVRGSELPNKTNILRYIERFADEPAACLEEALQRILIINQLQWQTGHILVGLGRLDLCLEQYHESEETARKQFGEFFGLLHKYYVIKSNALMGDTGQIVILGGRNNRDQQKSYRYTKLIMDVIKELRIPDPKILVRVDRDTDDIMWTHIAEYMTGACGSPLISNDDMVIKYMTEFGYDKEDANDYITAACWEPIAAGSYEQNNILSLNYLEPFERISKKHLTGSIDSYERLLEVYYEELERYAGEIADTLSKLRWEKDTLYSLFDTGAHEKRLDISQGGAKYDNYGILSVALANTVNSLYVIKKLVFEDKVYSFSQLDSMRRKDFKGFDEVLSVIKGIDKVWGHDEESVYELINEITERTYKALNHKSDMTGRRIKLGLSSPHYIMNSVGYSASFDGRRKGEPFAVHISSSDSRAYTEILNFAAGLDYSDGRFNGDTVDIVISPGLIRKNIEAFIMLLKTAVSKGVFQIQSNIIDSKTLEEAKKEPEKFPDLIVRVWGFNAYFNQLPEEYKDYLIERTKQSELANNRYTEIQSA